MHRGAWRKKVPTTSRQVNSLLPGQKFMSQYVTVTRNGEKFVDVPDSEKTAQEKINVNGEETGQLSPFWTEVFVSVEKLGDISVNDMVKEQKKTYYENNKDKIKKQGRVGAS